jgi:hypothetical protein
MRTKTVAAKTPRPPVFGAAISRRRARGRGAARGPPEKRGKFLVCRIYMQLFFILSPLNPLSTVFLLFASLSVNFFISYTDKCIILDKSTIEKRPFLLIIYTTAFRSVFGPFAPDRPRGHREGQRRRAAGFPLGPFFGALGGNFCKTRGGPTQGRTRPSATDRIYGVLPKPKSRREAMAVAVPINAS